MNLILKDSKILVTGGSGFIGTNLIKHLLSLGCNQIRATYHEHPPFLHQEAVEYVKADLTSKTDCKKVVSGRDYVFMCAAKTFGAAAMKADPLALVTPNILMNSLMLEAAYEAKVKKFLFISSSAAYPPTNHPVKEEEMFIDDPHEAYYGVGWMKRFSEILCKMYAQKIKNPMATVVVRPSNIYGPYAKFNFQTSHMQHALIRRVVEKQNPIEVWGTGKDVRDLIFIDDFIDGLMLAFIKSDVFLAVNVASGKARTVQQILETIQRVDGWKAEIRFNRAKPTTIPSRLINTDLAEKILGFKAKTTLEEGMRNTIEWYRKQGSEWNR